MMMIQNSMVRVALALVTVAGSAVGQVTTGGGAPGNDSMGKMKIERITPTKGGPGTLVVIEGAGFGGGSADDLCVMTRGARSVNLRARSRTDSVIVAEVLGVPKDALPGPIMIMSGTGGTVPVPPYSGVSFPDGVFGFLGDATDPSTMAQSAQVFTPTAGSSLALDCPPPDYEFALWEHIQGNLCLQLPDNWCDGDYGLLSLDFTLSSGDAWDIIAESIDYGDGTSALERGEALEYAINTLFVDWGLSCFAVFDPSTNLLKVICPGESFVGYSGYFERYFGPTVVTTIADEVEDGFTSPTPTNLIPGSDFEAWVIANCPGGESKPFDEWDSRCFAHTMTFAPGPILSASLEIHLGAGSPLPEDDTIRLGFQGTSFMWERDLDSMIGVWEPGETVTFCLDLAYLPLPGGIWVNVLDELESGELDILVSDDTAVDYIELNIRRCD